MTLHRAALAFALSTAITLPTYAFAADEPPIVTLMLKIMEQQTKVKPTYESVETNSDGAITVTGLAANLPVEGVQGAAMKLSIDEIELEEVSDEGGGLWEIGSTTYSNLKMGFSGPDGMAFNVDIPEMSAEDWYLKELGSNPSPMDVLRASLSIARKSSSGKITVTAGGQTYTSDGYTMTWDGDPATGSGKTTLKVTNIAIPESAIAAIDTTGQLKALGYSSLAFDLGGEGNLALNAETLGFDGDFYYTGRDMGTLKIGAAAAEIPAAVIAELQKDTAAQPDITKLMPELMKIQLSRLIVRFEDNSLTSKLLPVAAKMQGMDVQTLIANAGAMMQLGLAELKNPAFTQKTVEAVTAFLKDPKSITLSAKPAGSVSVQQLMAIDPANPGAAIDQFGITVTSND